MTSLTGFGLDLSSNIPKEILGQKSKSGLKWGGGLLEIPTVSPFWATQIGSNFSFTLGNLYRYASLHIVKSGLARLDSGDLIVLSIDIPIFTYTYRNRKNILLSLLVS